MVMALSKQVSEMNDESEDEASPPSEQGSTSNVPFEEDELYQDGQNPYA